MSKIVQRSSATTLFLYDCIFFSRKDVCLVNEVLISIISVFSPGSLSLHYSTMSDLVDWSMYYTWLEFSTIMKWD